MIINTREVEIEEVKKRMKQEKDRRMFERYQTIYLHLRGMHVKQIMEITGRTEPTVRSYIKSYQRNGLAGLQMNCSATIDKGTTSTI